MTVTVTNRDIARGVHEDGYLCPVALALTRAIGVGTYVQARVASIASRVGYRTFRLPAKVKTFIKAFDRGDNVAPFKFNLSVNSVKER